MSFPTYDFTPKVDNVDTIAAADINELQAAIEEIAEREYGGGGGGGDTYPMNPDIWYDNSTAMAGARTGSGSGLGVDYIAGGIIKVTEPDGNLTDVGIIVSTGPSPGCDVRLALYTVSETSTSRGLPGAKVADLGVIALDEYESGWQTLVVDEPVPLGYYWVCVASEQDIELLGWNIENERNGGGLIGIRAPDGGNYVAAAGVEIEYTAAHTAMPSTLVGVVDASMRVTDAPHIFFKVTPN